MASKEPFTHRGYRPGSPPESIVDAVDRAGDIGFWPRSAIEGALSDRDRLADVIDRAADAIASVDPEPLERIYRALKTVSPEQADVLWKCRAAINAVRAILAEAEPENLETSDGQ